MRLKGMVTRDVVERQAAALRHDIAAVARRYGDLLAVRLPEPPAAGPAAATPAEAGVGVPCDGEAAAGEDTEMADVPLAASAAASGADWHGDVLLSYRSVEAAERAAAALQGRTFDGRPLVAVVDGVH